MHYFRDHIAGGGEKFPFASFFVCTRGGMFSQVCVTQTLDHLFEKSIQGATGLLSNSKVRTLLRDPVI